MTDIKKTTYEGYAVQVRKKDGGTFLAHGADAEVAVFHKWDKASDYRRELKSYDLNVGKIVPVVVEVTVVGKGN